MRHLRLFMSALALLLTTASYAAVGKTFTNGNFTYTILTEDTDAKTGSVSVAAKETTISGTITIPQSVRYAVNGYTYTVTKFTANAFKNCEKITSVTVPETLIDWSADNIFNYTTKLQSVNIPIGVETIGNYCFFYCYSLTKISIPSSVKTIGTNAFHQANKITGVYITDIESWWRINFKGESSNPLYSAKTGNLYLNDVLVTDLTVPYDIKEIGQYVFTGCDCINTLNIHNAVKSIGMGAFANNKKKELHYEGSLSDWCNITFNSQNFDNDTKFYVQNDQEIEGDLVIPHDITTIGQYSFCGLKTINNLIIHDKITSIGQYAFMSTPITELTIPINVQSIGKQAFYNCNNLTKVTLAPSQITVGANAFMLIGTTSNPIPITAPDDFAFGTDTSGAYFKWYGGYFYLKKQFGPYDIDGLTFTVEEIDATNNTGKLSVRATDIQSITGNISIPQTIIRDNINYEVIKIAKEGFSGANLITSISIPDGVDEIGDGAFTNCTNLTEVNIPASVITIGNKPFENCSCITSVVIDSQNKIYSSYGCNVIQRIADNTLLYGFKTSEIPSQTKTIADEAFYNIEIENIVIPQNVTAIGLKAFYKSSLKSLEFSDNTITSFGEMAFANTKIKSLTLPNSITSLNKNVFENCGNLESVTFSTNINEIPERAFYNCYKLKDITFGGNLYKINDYAFYGCINIEELAFPKNLNAIGASAFAKCSKLSELSFPDGLKSIGGESFYACSNLENVNWANIQNIGIGAFMGCNLYSVILPNTVKSVGRAAFRNNNNLRVLKFPNSVESIGSLYGLYGIQHVTLPTYLKETIIDIYEGNRLISYDISFIAEQGTRIDELTLPANISNLAPLTWGYNSQASALSHLKSLFVMDESIPDALIYTNNNKIRNDYYFNIYHQYTIYVKPSVFNKYESVNNAVQNPYKANISSKIPLSMTNATGAPIEYKTLCRDFDVDLTHTNDNLPEGVEPLRAYVVEDVDGDLRMVFLDEIKYIPSRLKANVKDENGNLYQGVDEYVGVLLRGTPGYTYYYEMGEHDYTQGAEGQWLLDDAMEYSGKTYSANLMAGDANDEFYIYKTVEDDSNNEIVNYGLNSGRFKIYHKDGWLTYNKSYLQLPKHVSEAIEGDTDTEGNANLTFVFDNADGTTDKVSSIEVLKNAENDIFYNPYGQRVNANAKGIVINNGKKYVIK